MLNGNDIEDSCSVDVRCFVNISRVSTDNLFSRVATEGVEILFFYDHK